MRKLIIFIALIFICAASSAQESKFLARNKGVSFGIGYNNSGSFRLLKDDYITGVNGMSIYMFCWGAYLDVAFNTEGDQSGNMGIDIYDGYKTSAFHVGYAIPLCKWFRVIPVIGYSKWAEGYYDGSDYGVNGYGIVNRFYPRKHLNAVDYGVVLQFMIGKWVDIVVNVEAYNIGIGAGIIMPLK